MGEETPSLPELVGLGLNPISFFFLLLSGLRVSPLLASKFTKEWSLQSLYGP